MDEIESKQTVLNFKVAPVVIKEETKTQPIVIESAPVFEESIPVVIEEETKQKWSTVHNGVTLEWDRKEQADEIVKQ